MYLSLGALAFGKGRHTMLQGLRNIIKELREIRQILRDNTSGASRERIAREVAEEQVEREAEARAYRRKIERALRRKPNMPFAELRRRFPVGDERRTGTSRRRA
jgi:hypothetical protein